MTRRIPPIVKAPTDPDPMARWHALDEPPAPPIDTTLQFWDGETETVYVGRVDRRGEITIMNVDGPWPIMRYWAMLDEL